jgi:hypothetical protein
VTWFWSGVEINSFGIGSQVVLFVTVYLGMLQPEMQAINERARAGFENGSTRCRVSMSQDDEMERNVQEDACDKPARGERDSCIF